MKKVVEKVSRFLTKDHVENYYTLKQELGQGNFSVVRLGTNKKTGEDVAIKIIEKKKVGQKKEMLETEVEILKRVKHPYVIEMKEMFETSTHIYLVMELYLGAIFFFFYSLPLSSAVCFTSAFVISCFSF
jgi:serine/threonine protein kinase